MRVNAIVLSVDAVRFRIDARREAGECPRLEEGCQSSSRARAFMTNCRQNVKDRAKIIMFITVIAHVLSGYRLRRNEIVYILI
jgi:hypothetical protein